MFTKFAACFKVKGHKILQNLHQLYDGQYKGQIIGEDFAKLCGLLRIYELYKTILETQNQLSVW